ncbi:uncharacterized protein L969DRAFT_102120 [Mixia osmundae IAM 14324]|uniref:Alpha-ketoglutarate-dependent dioxygenase AlkB-like domain-containing protein n=1 Tax=Mixia osmundae (strain CBS 9802 / IAM 14324 / JCM 22182 / KY 12970) TaxID=764103 RepID=G7E5V7_MIXOS|nr:uncharacterized protein L969DRAFT_102120 [Mixia osmundae IAM 14324]KEI40631.1 hypothetical protein L969DRAFT_102120 [Mixia osmundae IAM 14324]GAA98217.1 hypothetical protein E5Q_04900 [Mixia osmundae IAM 14324]
MRQPEPSRKQARLLAKQRAQRDQAASEHTAFRQAERYWKSRIDSPQYEHAFRSSSVQWHDTPGCSYQIGTWTDGRVKLTYSLRRHRLNGVPDALAQRPSTSSEWQSGTYAITFDAAPGLVYLPGWAAPPLQRQLIKSCLCEAADEHHPLSLSPHFVLPPAGLWDTYQRWRRTPQEPAGADSWHVPRKTVAARERLRRERVDLEPVTTGNFMSERKPLPSMHANEDPSKDQAQSEHIHEVMERLRWAIIGFEYSWTDKAYYYDRPFSPMPDLISRACTNTVKALPWADVFTRATSEERAQYLGWANDYEPQTGIVNFYGARDTLTGHIDQSEPDAVRPLVSISLGTSAVFLAGGETRDARHPLPFLLRSGDAIVMSGPSRRVFHGIPRVLDHLPAPAHLTSSISDDPDWTEGGFADYMSAGRRININDHAQKHSTGPKSHCRLNVPLRDEPKLGLAQLPVCACCGTVEASLPKLGVARAAG